MIALLQRVAWARVDVEGSTVGEIGAGLLALWGVERYDEEAQADRLLERVLSYRLFSDAAYKMNLSLKDIQGSLLLVPQFTLAADTRKGNRPSFHPAATPEDGKRLFDYVAERARREHGRVATGIFGADMKVSLLNDGPVTFWLQVKREDVGEKITS